MHPLKAAFLIFLTHNVYKGWSPELGIENHCVTEIQMLSGPAISMKELTYGLAMPSNVMSQLQCAANPIHSDILYFHLH